MNISHIFKVVFQVSCRLLLYDAPPGPVCLTWKKLQNDTNASVQGSERSDFLRQAMKHLEGEGAGRKGIREGKAARDHRDLLGLWLRGKRKQR